MAVVTSNTIQPASGQALTIKDEGGTASITVATNGEATFAENIKITANKGINFSAYATSGNPSSNLLNDYEEGTWTVTNTNDGGGSVFSSQTAHYTKIGNIVHIQAVFVCNATTSTSFGGLPFTIKNDNASRALGFVPFQSATSTGGYFFGIFGDDNTKTFHFQEPTARYFTSGNELYLAGKYTTDE
jgi:hypothetical protein